MYTLRYLKYIYLQCMQASFKCLQWESTSDKKKCVVPPPLFFSVGFSVSSTPPNHPSLYTPLYCPYSLCHSPSPLSTSSLLFLLLPRCASTRLRSVKMEQRKLNDQANTLVDLAKVSLLTFKSSHDYLLFLMFLINQLASTKGHTISSRDLILQANNWRHPCKPAAIPEFCWMQLVDICQIRKNLCMNSIHSEVFPLKSFLEA